MADNVDVVIEDTTVEIVVSEAGAPGINGVDGQDGATIVFSTTPPPADHTREWVDTTSGIRSYWYVDAWVVSPSSIEIAETIPALAYLNSTGGGYITSTGGYYTSAA